MVAMPGILVSMSEGSLLEGRGSGAGVNLSSTGGVVHGRRSDVW